MLHVLPPPVVGQPEIAWVNHTDTPYHQASRRLQDAVPAETHLWSSVKHAVQYGQPYAEILNYADNNEIDLIALGAHGAGFGIHTFIRFKRRQSAATGALSFAGRASNSRNSKHKCLCVN